MIPFLFPPPLPLWEWSRALYPTIPRRVRAFVGTQWLRGREAMIAGALERGDVPTASLVADSVLEDLGW